MRKIYLNGYYKYFLYTKKEEQSLSMIKCEIEDIKMAQIKWPDITDSYMKNILSWINRLHSGNLMITEL